jgi:aryl-alcohol dehydrogenase-like predicted oxidoreductase
VLAQTAAAAAGTWTLGDRTVNRLGLGAMRLTGTGAFDHGRPRDRDQAIRVLRHAVELGVNHIDTAAFYFSSLRSANELINSALAPYPDELVVVTKVGPGRDPSGEWLPWARPEQLRGQVEENLRQLGRDCLDVVNLRAYGKGSLADHLGALSELREAGLVRHLGVSNVDVEQLREALDVVPVVCVQNRYGVGDRASEEVLRACAEQDIAFVPFFSMAGAGGAVGRQAEEDDAVLAVARAHGASATQVRIAWTLQLGPHVLAIPGTGDPEHLEDNVAAASLRLTDDDLALLAGVGAPG